MKSAKNTGLHKIIWLVTLLPLLIAWTMAYFGIGLPSTTKNNGVLMAETMQVPNSLTQLHQGKWGLLVISDHCDARCQQQVYRMQQLYKSMAKHHERIQAIWVASPQTTSRDKFAGDIDFEKIQKNSLIKFSAGGLRDFSRIAASNEIMWRDVFLSNKKNMVSAINLFTKNLNLFKKNIERKDSKQLVKKLINSKKVRKQIIKLKQDIDKPDFGRK